MALVESFSGIRGIYGESLTDAVAIKYAYAYLLFLRKKSKKSSLTIVIGRDTRPSGENLRNSILSILDCSFIEAGIASTPAVQFAVRHFNADGGIILTASHNEPYWNGLKFLGKDGALVSEADSCQIIQNFKVGSLRDFHKIRERKFTNRIAETRSGYIGFLKEVIGNEGISKIRHSGQRILLDANGGTGSISKDILKEFGAEAIGVNMEPGEFNRKVAPTEESMSCLKNLIDESKADFAAGFDCDADRLGIVLKDGTYLPGDYILALVVSCVLSHGRKKRAYVVVNDATSGLVKDVVQSFGAKIKEVEVGEVNVVSEMDRLKAVAGGEGSSGGAIITPSKCRDGMLSLLMIMLLIAKNGKKIEELTNELPKYFTLSSNIEYNKPNYNSIKKFIKGYYTKKGFKIQETGGILGGLKVNIADKSFVWFRASKTEEGVFRVIADSNSRDTAKSLMDEALRIFHNNI